VAREVGCRDIAATPLCHLATVARYRGDFPTARARYEESLTVAREASEPWTIAGTLHYMGKLACFPGDYPTARSHCGEALAIRRKLGDRRGIFQSLEGLAWAAGGEGQPTRVARLLGAVEALREKNGIPVAPVERADYASYLAAARAALGEAAFAPVPESYCVAALGRHPPRPRVLTTPPITPRPISAATPIQIQGSLTPARCAP
jgi:hypothetical protein